jgi:hypothetical protein
MRTCPAGCDATYDHAGRLAAHLTEHHLMNAGPAITKAREVFAQEEPMAAACGYCKRTDGSHSEKCAKKDGCKLCDRKAPAKCKRHGGEATAPKARAAHTNGADPVLRAIDAKIDTLRQQIGALEMAREALR